MAPPSYACVNLEDLAGYPLPFLVCMNRQSKILCRIEVLYFSRFTIEDIKTRFFATYGTQRPKTAVAFAMNDDFRPVLQQQTVFFSF